MKLVEPDYKVKALGDFLPWGVDRINAELVWNGTEGGTDVVAGRNAGDGINVSIQDTGIDYNHPDLAGNYKGGYDFVNNDADPMDDHGHGTHCAGIVAAVDNEIGVIGTAPKVNLYGIKVLNASGIGYVSDVVAGIEWSVNNSMKIISMSIGTKNNSTLLHEACNKAYDAGLLLVAAGNDGNSEGSGDNVVYPANYTSVIAVAATNESDKRAEWSSTGPAVELSAPGINIYSTHRKGEYMTMNGTSVACPHVTGTAALVWRAYPGYNNTQIRQRLQETAEDLGDNGRDTLYGYGLVNAERATDTTPPASITNLTYTSGTTWINWTWTNPTDADFNYTMVYLNGPWKTNTSDKFFNATGLNAGTDYEIATRTVDTNGNINETWVNQTATTLPYSPNITSFSPADTTPTSDEDASMTFNITIDQTANVSWQINGTEVQMNTSVTEASYTNTSAIAGYWNISVIVSNSNGTDIQTWMWTVNDITPPVISNIAILSITTTSATITWNTNELSDSLVKYGTTSGSYPLSASDTTYVKSHSIVLSGLASSTCYF